MAKLKDKVIQIRISKEEYDFLNHKLKQFQKDTGIKITKSSYIRHCLSKVNNLDFLFHIGFITYSDYMDATLFNRTKYKRAKKCKR